MLLLRCLSSFCGIGALSRFYGCLLDKCQEFFICQAKKWVWLCRGKKIAHFTSGHGIRWKKALFLYMGVKMKKKKRKEKKTITYYRCEKRQWKRAEEVGLYLYWRITDSCTSHRLLSCSLCRVTGLWVLFKPQAWASWKGLKALHLTSTVHTVSQRQQSKKQRQRDGEKKREIKGAMSRREKQRHLEEYQGLGC